MTLLAAPAMLHAQTVLEPFSPPAGHIIVVERSDFSRYEDGHYIGHLYRESRLDLSVEASTAGSLRYDGEALVLEETLRDERAVARRLDTAIPVSFSVDAGGAVRFTTDDGYPILRGLPDSPPKPALPGQRWTGEGTVVVRPRAGFPATRIAVLVEYEYLGPTTYGTRSAASIRARYAIRYRGGDRQGDPALTGASGARTADIVLDARDGATLFIRETVDETFTYSGSPAVRLKGFILHFHRGSLPGERDRIASILAPAAGPADAGIPVPGMETATATDPAGGAGGPPAVLPPGITAGGVFEVAEGTRGVILLLYDLRFVADGDQLLLDERGRLDAIVDALKRIPDRSFLVEGHTADLGRPAGQYELSERRARRIVDELVARGLPASRFVYRGLGADYPIAPNDTEANRARNRRVEITILD
jgi:outer membrane protein OmpA-like peptidoglycan-associated protein